jgi:hypothetical protein
MKHGHTRRLLSSVCGALGVLLVFAALLLGYLTRSLFNEAAFSVRVAASLEDPRFANFAAEQIADALIKAKPDLVGLRPVIIGVARSIVSSAPFRAAVRRSARTAHHAIMTGTGRDIVLDVKDVGVLLESVSETNPALSKKIPPKLSAALGKLSDLPEGEVMMRLVRLAHRMRVLTFALLVAGVALTVASVWLSSGKRRAIVRVGMALGALSVVLGLVAQYGGEGISLFVRRSDYSPALAGLAGAFLRGMLTWAMGLGFAGLVLAAAASSLLERVALRRWKDRVVAWLVGPQPLMRYRLARGVLGAAVGAALIFAPQTSLGVLAWLAGVVVAFLGLREAFFAALHLLPELEAKASAPAAERRRAGGRRIAFVSGTALLLIAATAWLVLRSEETAALPREITYVNGSAAITDRPLDRVIFPTTHNSMSGANVPGWMFPNQSADIDRQLADGIRGFLIDAHYGVPVGDRVMTELSDSSKSFAKYAAAVGEEGLEAALRIRDRLSRQPRGERSVYMCHGFCELGALELQPVLENMRDFLVANPAEVLVIVIQDENVPAKEIERVFEESGLVDFVYRGPARPPWPTMRELVETDQRVLVFAENDTTGVSWYHPAFAVMQETPYTFHKPDEFSNLPNRGGTGGSLMLLNHWIETTPMPKPSNAAIVNARAALLARLQDFRKRRGRYPNLVAVDFYGTGDLIQVVSELNEEPLPPPTGRARR